MPVPNSRLPQTDGLLSLRDAIAAGDRAAILATIPEPPHFLAMVFSLEPSERDSILAGVFQALDTDEDKWEIIEAAAMDSIARPECGSFVAVARYVPADMLNDARNLAARLPNPDTRREAYDALTAQAAHLERPITG
jgi:hypothetical protein